jgi:hypothetical protein
MNQSTPNRADAVAVDHAAQHPLDVRIQFGPVHVTPFDAVGISLDRLLVVGDFPAERAQIDVENYARSRNLILSVNQLGDDQRAASAEAVDQFRERGAVHPEIGRGDARVIVKICQSQVALMQPVLAAHRLQVIADLLQDEIFGNERTLRIRRLRRADLNPTPHDFPLLLARTPRNVLRWHVLLDTHPSPKSGFVGISHVHVARLVNPFGGEHLQIQLA